MASLAGVEGLGHDEQRRAERHGHRLSGLIARVITPAMLVLLPVLVFLACFHPQILNPANAAWLLDGTDNGENALGAHAYWHDSGAGASLRTNLLNAPEGVPILYTDSNPLLTMIAKPFAALLPADAQLVGPFILVCLVLQTLFAWLLLRRRAPGPVALWAGVVFLAFPPTLAHRYLHVNLMAHWTILAALLLFLDRDRRDRPLWWAALIATTTLIHSYLLVMVLAIWAAALLARGMTGGWRDKGLAALEFVGTLALVAVLARWLGVGDQMSTNTFGAFAMPMDALWNPGVVVYDTLIPGRNNDAIWFEGFQYMGVGGLLLVATAVGTAWCLPERAGEGAVLARLRQLAPALLALTILAIARLPLPPALLALLDPVRASGRLFWPVGYVMVFVALLSIYRLPARSAGLTLAALLALQAVDLHGMAGAIRERSARIARATPFDRTIDPRWATMLARSPRAPVSRAP